LKLDARSLGGGDGALAAWRTATRHGLDIELRRRPCGHVLAWNQGVARALTSKAEPQN